MRAPAAQYRLAMTTVPPGWYDDGHGGMRWWDGTRWTEHIAAAEPVQPDAGSSPYWGGEPAAGQPEPVAFVKRNAFAAPEAAFDAAFSAR